MSVAKRIHQARFRSPSEQAFVSLLYVAAGVNQRLEDVCSRHGLTHTQYNVLRILRGAHPDGHARCAIVERVIGRAPDVTRLLDRLEAQGWVERGWSESNRRLSIARITTAGLELLSRLDPDIRQVEQETVGALSPAELKQLCRICDRIAATADENC